MRTYLSDAYHISSTEGHWPTLCLDRSRLREPGRIDLLLQKLGNAGFFKVGDGIGNVFTDDFDFEFASKILHFFA